MYVKISSSLCCLSVILGIVYFAVTKGGASMVPPQLDAVFEAKNTTKKPPPAPAAPAVVKGGTGVGTVGGETEEVVYTDPPEARLANFAFEPKTKPGYVPNKKGRLAPKPAGNPAYKLVGCRLSGAYAIRWHGRYLTLVSPTKMLWTLEKEEPNSCFKIVPGYCGGDGKSFVMLRSVTNKHFVRFENTTGALVCKDSPTSRTSAGYCWKLQPDSIGTRQPCGSQYSFDLGRVIDVPCDVVATPAPGQSCSTVTAGYKANCCIKKGPTDETDEYCKGTVWFDVVGRPLAEALLVLRTRRPDLTFKPCPEPCTLQATPLQNPNLVVVPYDARSGIVTSPARVLV